MDNKAVIWGVLAGLVIGVSAGILLAPQSGRETRRMMKDKAMEAKDFAEEKMVEIKTKAGKVIGVIAEKYAHSLDEVKGF
jgi:gas vesicle protein